MVATIELEEPSSLCQSEMLTTFFSAAKNRLEKMLLQLLFFLVHVLFMLTGSVMVPFFCAFCRVFALVIVFYVMSNNVRLYACVCVSVCPEHGVGLGWGFGH